MYCIIRSFMNNISRLYIKQNAVLFFTWKQCYKCYNFLFSDKSVEGKKNVFYKSSEFKYCILISACKISSLNRLTLIQIYLVIQCN